MIAQLFVLRFHDPRVDHDGWDALNSSHTPARGYCSVPPSKEPNQQINTGALIVAADQTELQDSGEVSDHIRGDTLLLSNRLS